MFHSRRKCGVLIVAVMVWQFLLVDARAQDRVTHIPVGASKPITSIGEIIEFTGSELALQTRVSLQRIPSDRIERIETHYVKEHLLGREQFTNGETDKAIQSLRLAVKSEPRTWVDREILALIVQAELRLQNLSGAMHDFQTILNTDPATRHWGIAPMVWSPQV
ncbi:MAG TPA: hypothetical protein VNQ76_18570, partial [Planctomicrobium sp.]|nr:hypothetical protein [Planctomicrobium sp.]